MKFTKMHGIGNDYIYFNCFEEKIKNPGELSIKLSDRHFGAGGDGIVLILPSDKADFRMRMFNADGSEGKMCGNASRCVGKYLYEKGLTKKTSIKLETLSGIKVLDLKVVNEKVVSVKVNMGKPIVEAKNIPFITEATTEAHAPVPQARVSPLPLSQTLIFIYFSLIISTNSVLILSGKISLFSKYGPIFSKSKL